MPTMMPTWAHAWADKGWEPIVLTEIDASRHPEYIKYRNKLSVWKIPPTRLRSFLRYLAMSTIHSDGGWYADMNVYPIKQLCKRFHNHIVFA